jgi:hypothetical protein
LIRACVCGNCVLTDLYWIVKSEDLKLEYIYSKPSFITMMSKKPPIKMKHQDLELTSRFLRQAIINDFQKDFFQKLKVSNVQYLLFDIIGELHPVIKWKDSYLLRTPDFIKSGVEKHLEGFELLRRDSDEVIELWQDSFQEWSKKIVEYIPEERIFFLETYPATTFLEDGEEKSYELPPSYQLLDKLSKELYIPAVKQALPGANILKPDEKFRIANKQHIWGESPFHFIDDYYFDMYKQLISKVTEIEEKG